MSSQAKRSIAIVGAFVLVVLGVLSLGAVTDDAPTPAPTVEGETRLVRADSHVLGEEGDSGVTFVEFLDLECEGCRAAYPAVEQLREDYAGQVTFVVRYFPMPGHFNGERAARAVEAAAQQGSFEDMYHRMYETQAEWGEQQVPHDDLFASFAEDLGLDLDQWQADYDDPATAERVAKDVADGQALGVQGTPTFFVDGEELQPRTYEDLTDALDAALAR
ncbi:thioredoxin domain-containing protein [Microbacterium sp. ARD31]|uniref:DsbA family protein n=1 Tax=Microbacterium sp. ARD31 TaxID=2962576 RepID=UPI00288100CB|nr:thioredoxin domain-containing protein [Microbacterium sp. ARD31]MDT0187915.1 thioredoxin domain-containing protein [Microbacterium sp. ARD31]